MNLGLLIVADIIILLLSYFFSIYLKILITYRNTNQLNKKPCFWHVLLVLIFYIIMPTSIIIKWFKTGEMQERSKTIGKSPLYIALKIYKVSYYETDALLNVMISGLMKSSKNRKFLKYKTTVRKQSTIYSNYVRRYALA